MKKSILAGVLAAPLLLAGCGVGGAPTVSTIQEGLRQLDEISITAVGTSTMTMGDQTMVLSKSTFNIERDSEGNVTAYSMDTEVLTADQFIQIYCYDNGDGTFTSVTVNNNGTPVVVTDNVGEDCGTSTAFSVFADDSATYESLGNNVYKIPDSVLAVAAQGSTEGTITFDGRVTNITVTAVSEYVGVSATAKQEIVFSNHGTAKAVPIEVPTTQE